MASQLFHHPGFQIALPLVAALLIYRVGVVMTDRIVDIPVQSIKPQPKPAPLGSKSMPTVYIPAKATKGIGEDGDMDALFNQPAPPSVTEVDPGKAAETAVTEMPLSDYLANLVVTGIGDGGVFINGVFYRKGNKIDVDVPQRDGAAVRPTIVAITARKITLKAGSETCVLPMPQ